MTDTSPEIILIRKACGNFYRGLTVGQALGFWVYLDGLPQVPQHCTKVGLCYDAHFPEVEAETFQMRKR